jgi:hypothetical protein
LNKGSVKKKKTEFFCAENIYQNPTRPLSDGSASASEAAAAPANFGVLVAARISRASLSARPVFFSIFH